MNKCVINTKRKEGNKRNGFVLLLLAKEQLCWKLSILCKDLYCIILFLALEGVQV